MSDPTAPGSQPPDLIGVGPTPMSSGPVSLNTLRLALGSMKERCTRQSKRIEELEKENVTVRSSRNDLYAEVKRLHEANLKLREKNLALNQVIYLFWWRHSDPVLYEAR